MEEMIAESKRKLEEWEREKLGELGERAQPPIDPNERRVRGEIKFPRNQAKIDPYDPSTFGYTELGTIVGAHGVKGELKISATTDFAKERLCEKAVRHLKAPYRRAPRRVTLLSGRHRMKDEYLIILQGVLNRDQALELRGSTLYAREEERPELAQDEYLVKDLVGLDAFIDEGWRKSDGEDIGGELAGKVTGIVLGSEMSAVQGIGQDLLELTCPRAPDAPLQYEDEHVLVPFVPELVPRVDLQDGCIYIRPPDGLLDLKYFRTEKVRIRGFLPLPKDVKP